jgi:hypothetical protein
MKAAAGVHASGGAEAASAKQAMRLTSTVIPGVRPRRLR